jgi:hypothetical protein
MSIPILTAAGTIQCPHAAPGSLVASSTKVLIDSAPPLLAADKGTISGCPFTVPTGKPQPCVTALLTKASSKVLVEGKPVLLMNPSDMCQSAEQIPQGPVVWGSLQTKVVAT